MFENYDDVVTIKELQKMLHVGRNKAYSLIQSGEIYSIQSGRLRLIPKQAVIDYIMGKAHD